MHSCEVVEEQDSGYVLVCSCGWRSPAERTAAAVGDRWDDHRGIRL